MYAIRQIHNVHNRTITIELPPDFPADRVEVIVLPVEEPVSAAPPVSLVLQEFLALDTSHFNDKQRAAYDRVVTYLQTPRDPNAPRVFGLFEGMFEVPDDFNDPLPPEIEDLFWGSESDEYGMSIQR